MLKAIIVDPLWLSTQGSKGHSQFIDPTYIPRVGDEVRWANHTIAKVKSVLWDYDTNLVTVVVS